MEQKDKFKKSEKTDWSEVIKEGVNKMDPNMIFKLATLIIERKHNLEELKIKGDFFLKALKIHEETVRGYLKNHHEETMAVISVLKELIQKETNESLKKEALIRLAEFGSLSVKGLSQQAISAFENIPRIK